MKTIITTLAALTVSFFVASTSIAQDGPKMRQQLEGNPINNQLAYFSPRLGARFTIQTVQIGNFNPARVARIVSHPEPGSPLAQIGLRQGDLITRLDGNPISNLQELDKHILDTTVRYVKAGTQHLHEDTIMIDPGMFFQDPYGNHNHVSDNVLTP